VTYPIVPVVSLGTEVPAGGTAGGEVAGGSVAVVVAGAGAVVAGLEFPVLAGAEAVHANNEYAITRTSRRINAFFIRLSPFHFSIQTLY